MALNCSTEDLDELLMPDRDDASANALPSVSSNTPLPADGRVAYALRNPRSVDLVTVAQLRQQVHELDSRYDTTPSALLVAEAGECLGHIMLLKGYAGSRVARELRAAETEAATLVGQLVWDASQRRQHSVARLYFEQARTAARQVHDPSAEGLAFLRDSFVALYGERDPRRGLDLAVQAATVGGKGSSVIAGLALLHTAEAYAMLQERRACEQALGQAESVLADVDRSDPAAERFSPTQLGRLSSVRAISSWVTPNGLNASSKTPPKRTRSRRRARRSCSGIWHSHAFDRAKSTTQLRCFTARSTWSTPPEEVAG
jgi:hypothetical protein